MLKVFLLFILLIAGIVLGPMLAGHQGYVLIQTDNYNIETSVTGLTIILILGVVVLFALEWILRRLFRTGAHTRGWFVGRKRRRARKQTEQALLKLAEGDYQQVEKLMSKNADHAEQPVVNYLLAAEAAHTAQADGEPVRIWTAGGDGTFNEALTGAQGCGLAAVGCLPFGSGNDFLRTYGTREEFNDLDAQLAGSEVDIDLMQTDLGLSATICAAGLDAQVAYGIPQFRRIPFCGGEMAYALSIVKQLCGHIGRNVTFTIDGEELTVDCLMCAVCNGRTYGGGFYAAPEAQPDDGWLDVFIIRRVSRLTIARLLGMYKSGRHFRNGELTEQAKPYFIYRRAKCVSLRPADGRGPIVATADGECAPCDAITAQLKPLAGRVLLPKPAYERFMAQRANV